MNIFLSYAAEDRDLAEGVQLALAGNGHEVFFDRESLSPASEFHSVIRNAVEQSDIFVFLISPSSVTRFSYTLTELEYAKARWRHPQNRVLPVLAREVSPDCIPGYLKAVNILEPKGNIPAEVMLAVSRMLEDKRSVSFDLGVNLGWLQQGSEFGGRPVDEMAAALERVRREAIVRTRGDAEEMVATAQGLLEEGQPSRDLADAIRNLILLFQGKAEDTCAAALVLGVALGRLHQGAAANNLPAQLSASCLESARTHASKARYRSSYNGLIDNALTKLSSGQPSSAILLEVTHLIGLFQGQD